MIFYYNLQLEGIDMKTINARKILGMVVLSTMFLTGCGGGSDGGSTSYISWINNANGDLIVDWNNEYFRVETSTRRIERENGTVLLGSYVDSDARVYADNIHIGYVGSTISTAGNTIAVLRCNSTVVMNIFRTSSDGWSFEC